MLGQLFTTVLVQLKYKNMSLSALKYNADVVENLIVINLNNQTLVNYNCLFIPWDDPVNRENKREASDLRTPLVYLCLTWCSIHLIIF